MSTISKEFAAVKKQIKTLREEARGKAKAAFRDGANALFEKFPEMKSFSWSQYTPYFNDGDECVFRANTDQECIDINGEEGDEIASEHDWDGTKLVPKAAEVLSPLLPAQKAVAKFLGAFDSEDFRDTFGDHVGITITRKGIRVESYSHD